MRIWGELGGMGVASLAAVLMVMSGAVPASASEPSFGAEPNEPVAIFSDQVAAGISMDSELYDTIVNSPGFHYAPAPDADKETVTGSGSGADLTSPVMAPDVWAGKCEYTGRGTIPMSRTARLPFTATGCVFPAPVHRQPESRSICRLTGAAVSVAPGLPRIPLRARSLLEAAPGAGRRRTRRARARPRSGGAVAWTWT